MLEVRDKGPVHLAYNPSYSACFFSRNSIVLSQKSANNVFQPAYNSSRTGPKLTNAAQLAMRSCGPSCQRESGAGAGRTFDLPWLTRCERVRLVWHAIYVKMVNPMLKLLSSDKFIIATLRMIFGRVTIIIMVKI
jgi:hypothetical protein